MKKFKVYTKTGDTGQTSLVGGKRVAKSDDRLNVYGTVDELNVNVGALRDKLKDDKLKDNLLKIQNELFVLGSLLAYDGSVEVKLPILTKDSISFLEEKIDEMDEVIPPLKNFVLPGGHEQISSAHLCRVVCRRAERLLVKLAENTEMDQIYIKFLNRLSDYFFVLSRYLAFINNVDEIPWKPDKY